MRRPAIRVLVSGAVCLVILIAMLVINAWPLWYGQSIYLKVQPVDPRDLMRGDYVTLSYPISRLCVSAQTRSTATQPNDRFFQGPSEVPVKGIGDWFRTSAKDDFVGYYGSRWDSLRGKTLYLQLERVAAEDSRIPASYRPVSLSDAPVAGAVNLRGTVISAYGAYHPDGRRFDSDVLSVQMNYGIDAWFVQEGQGRKIEERIRANRWTSDKAVYAEIAVLPGGTARVRRLIGE